MKLFRILLTKLALVAILLADEPPKQISGEIHWKLKYLLSEQAKLQEEVNRTLEAACTEAKIPAGECQPTQDPKTGAFLLIRVVKQAAAAPVAPKPKEEKKQ